MWFDVCKPKSKERLGVCNIHLVNFILLSKCQWRLILASTSLWRNVISPKYRSQVITFVIGEMSKGCRYTYILWKEIPSQAHHILIPLSIGMCRNMDNDFLTSIRDNLFLRFFQNLPDLCSEGVRGLSLRFQMKKVALYLEA